MLVFTSSSSTGQDRTGHTEAFLLALAGGSSTNQRMVQYRAMGEE